jgi:hypothetical protein
MGDFRAISTSVCFTSSRTVVITSSPSSMSLSRPDEWKISFDPSPQPDLDHDLHELVVEPVVSIAVAQENLVHTATPESLMGPLG